MKSKSPTTSPAITLALLLVFGVATPGPAQICGNGIVEPPEECDDGSGFRLDGCTPDCTYEHTQRVVALELASGTSPAICTPTTNAFGGALTSAGLTGLNTQLAAEIDNGSLNQLLQLLDLNDPAAVDDPDLDVGALEADRDPRGSIVGMDAWYLAHTGALDGDDLPVVQVPGAIAARELAAGPARIELGFINGAITLRDTFISATVGPLTSLPAPPPDQLAAGFQAFETLHADDGNHGLCGNLTVGSLALLPLPEDFTSGGAAACSDSCSGSRSYTWCGQGNPVGPGCNSMLDMVVGGCAVTPPFCVGVIVATQPDVGTGGQPPEVLSADPTTGKVTVVQPEDAYSMWFEFSSQRVHMTNHLGGLFTDGFESSDLGAWSSGGAQQ